MENIKKRQLWIILLCVSFFTLFEGRAFSAYKEEKQIVQNLNGEDIPFCQFTKENSCQNKQSAGHLNTIRSTLDGFCAKELRRKDHWHEVAFYKDLNKILETKSKNKYLSFFPRFNGLCKEEETNKIYFLMENLKKDWQAKGLIPLEMDIKIGRHTYDKEEYKKDRGSLTCFFKGIKHFFLDDIFSTSFHYGFRVVSNSSKASSLDLALHPKKHIKNFIGTKWEKECFLNKLRSFQDFTNSSSFNNLKMVASSLLFLKGDEEKNISCQIYVIDFAHAQVKEKLSNSDDRDEHNRDGFRQGIESLISLLEALF
jgi:hypothetical protein